MLWWHRPTTCHDNAISTLNSGTVNIMAERRAKPPASSGVCFPEWIWFLIQTALPLLCLDTYINVSPPYKSPAFLTLAVFHKISSEILNAFLTLLNLVAHPALHKCPSISKLTLPKHLYNYWLTLFPRAESRFLEEICITWVPSSFRDTATFFSVLLPQLGQNTFVMILVVLKQA